MSSSPGSGGSNPRKFSEKIALHNQKQAEETRAFEQLMTDLTVSRVKIKQTNKNNPLLTYVLAVPHHPFIDPLVSPVLFTSSTVTPQLL